METCSEYLPCPSTYTRLCLQRWPQAEAFLLRGTGLSSEQLVSQDDLTVAQQLTVFRNVRDLAGSENWAIDIGRQFNFNSHGPLGFAALSAPTLGEGFATLAEFARIRTPYVGYSVSEVGKQLALRFHTDIYPLGDMAVPIIEALQQTVLSYTDAILGVGNVHASLCFAYPPRGFAKRYRDVLTCHYTFSAGFNGVVLPLRLKDLPSPMRDEKVYRSSLARCRERLVGLLSDSDVVARATHWLAAYFEQIATNRKMTSLPRLEQLADTWRVTPRTVIRQLKERGTSFSELRSDQQLQMAYRMLDDAGYTISEVGYLLGYGDPANFGRAFKRLTDKTPGDYRRRTR